MNLINPKISSESCLAASASKRFTVLCVDDELSVLKALKRLLKSPLLHIMTATRAAEALKLLQQHQADIIISDMRMPEMDGAEFLSIVAANHPHTIRLLLTGYADFDATIAAINAGQISRYLAKPWNNDELVLTIQDCCEKLRLQQENQQLLLEVEEKNRALALLNSSLETKVRQRTAQINQALLKLKDVNLQVKNNLNSTIRTFYNLISFNPSLGGSTCLKISQLCVLLAQDVAASEAFNKEVQLAGLLCELGMIGLEQPLIETPINELTPDDRQRYLGASQQAHLALSPALPLKTVAHYILHQHEQFSGKGFPDSIEGEAIPLGARVLAVARDYVYATTGRLFKTRMSAQGAIEWLSTQAHSHYDPALIQNLPQAVAKLDLQTLDKNERQVAVSELKSDMRLSRDIINGSSLMLLPEGHKLNVDSIQRLQKFLATEVSPVEIFVQNA